MTLIFLVWWLNLLFFRFNVKSAVSVYCRADTSNVSIITIIADILDYCIVLLAVMQWYWRSYLRLADPLQPGWAAVYLSYNNRHQAHSQCYGPKRHFIHPDVSERRYRHKRAETVRSGDSDWPLMEPNCGNVVSLQAVKSAAAEDTSVFTSARSKSVSHVTYASTRVALAGALRTFCSFFSHK